MKYLINAFLFCTTLSLLVASCYGPRAAQRQVTKAQARYPFVLAKDCALFYPTKDSVSIFTITKEGKTDTMFQDVFIDCDTVRDTINRTVKIKVPQYIRHNDTIEKVVFQTQENQALTTSLNYTIDTLVQQAAQQKQLIKTNNKWLFGLAIYSLVVTIGALIYFYVKRVI